MHLLLRQVEPLPEFLVDLLIKRLETLLLLFSVLGILLILFLNLPPPEVTLELLMDTFFLLAELADLLEGLLIVVL